MSWRACPDDWQAPFRPAGAGDYFSWPLLADLTPWRHSGAQLKRTWPIAPDQDTLERRWRALLQEPDRARAFRETGDRRIDGAYPASPIGEREADSIPLAALPAGAPVPAIRRYAWRSFDRQWIIADGRLISRPRPALWRAHGPRQVYLTGLFSAPLGEGPALTACAHVPDLHHFSGRGAKDTIPLYRSADAAEPNLAPGLLDALAREYERAVTPEDLLAYIYGATAHPAFTQRFAAELEARELRVPMTKDPALFEKVRDAGARLLRLHTWGERFSPEGERPGRVPRGDARCARAVPGDPDACPEAFRYDAEARALHVGDGVFAPVAPETFGFPVSGRRVVASWLGYRMKRGAGRKSSPLDAIRPRRWPARFTTELLELLWILEATIAIRPEQARLLDAIAHAPRFNAEDLPKPVPETRAPPGRGADALL